MRKKVIILLIILSMVFPISALAVDQRPNAEVLLGVFSMGKATTSWTSNYCTATQSHINLRTDVSSSGSVDYKVQYRAPNSTWKDFTTKTSDGRAWKDSSSTYNINAVKGYDYRLKLSGSLFWEEKGTVVCW